MVRFRDLLEVDVLFIFDQLLDGDWADELRGESIPSGYFAGGLRLIDASSTGESIKAEHSVQYKNADEEGGENSAAEKAAGVECGFYVHRLRLDVEFFKFTLKCATADT